MSWKSLVTASLLCVLASPAFAAPTLTVTKGGSAASSNLDANGNWVWSVQVAPDLSLMPSGDTSGTPVATELGFTSSSTGAVSGQGTIVSATQSGAELANFDKLNPGKSIFGWEANSGCDANGSPCGIQVGGTGTKQVFAALGSVNFTTAGPKQLLTITAQAPVVSSTNPNTTVTLQVSGAYGGNGRIAQINGGTSGGPYTTGNYDSFGGATYSFTRTARGGDANLDGIIDGADYNAVQNAWQQAGKKWFEGNFNGDNIVDGADYNFVQNAWQQSYSVGPVTPGAGSGLEGGSNVPEPASFAMLSLALLGGLGVIRRKR